MPIEDRNLAPGTVLVAHYKKEMVTCTLVEREEGARYELEDGRRFKSPSAAGSAVMKGIACNGWMFWSLQGDEPDVVERPSLPKPPRSAKVRAVQQVKKVRKQEGVAEGQVRWYCSACQEGFLVQADTTPEICPRGHARAVEADVSAVGPVEADAG